MKAPQDRKTAKKITERDLGYPNISMSGTEESISLAELGESRYPPTFRGEDEIRLLRDFCNAWLDAHEPEPEPEEEEEEEEIDPDSIETAYFEGWTDFLEAIREDELRWEKGAYARVEYDSNYSDEVQVLEGAVERTTNSLGKAFSLDGKAVQGFSVNGKRGRDVGSVKNIEFEVADQ